MMSTVQQLTEEEIKFQTPVRWFCIGPSGAGKTEFLKQLIIFSDDVFLQPVTNIVYCYATYQQLYDQMKQSCPKINFVEGFPSYVEDDYLSNPYQHDLLIIDDLVDQVSDSETLRDAYIRNSHHKNYSVITVTQNPFYKSKYLRTCSLQCTGYILFRCLRDQSMIVNLSKQIFPRNSSVLLDAYEQITSKPYKYMYLDFGPQCHPLLRIRGNILPCTELDVYVAK